jgi:hypothetical protein
MAANCCWPPLQQQQQQQQQQQRALAAPVGTAARLSLRQSLPWQQQQQGLTPLLLLLLLREHLRPVLVCPLERMGISWQAIQQVCLVVCHILHDRNRPGS